MFEVVKEVFEYGEYKSNLAVVTFQHSFGGTDTLMAINTIVHILKNIEVYQLVLKTFDYNLRYEIC